MSLATRREEIHVAGAHVYLVGQHCSLCDVLLVPAPGKPHPAGARVVLLADDRVTWKTTRPATCAVPEVK